MFGKTILIIIAMGTGSGTGVSIEKTPYGTEKNCQEAAKQINEYKTRNVHIEALCIEGNRM